MGDIFGAVGALVLVLGLGVLVLLFVALISGAVSDRSRDVRPPERPPPNRNRDR